MLVLVAGDTLGVFCRVGRSASCFDLLPNLSIGDRCKGRLSGASVRRQFPFYLSSVFRFFSVTTHLSALLWGLLTLRGWAVGLAVFRYFLLLVLREGPVSGSLAVNSF